MTVRRVVSIVAAVGLVAAGLVVGATPADASESLQVNVTKVVVGDPPAGSTFVVRIDCGTAFLDASFEAAGGFKELTFAGEGASCSVSEPQNGGADSTTFACENVSNVTCDTTTFKVDTFDAEVNITVTNTFSPPAPAAAAPAAAVPAAPTFTG